MHIRLKRHESNASISLDGKQLDIIRLPKSASDTAGKFQTALVMIHNANDLDADFTKYRECMEGGIPIKYDDRYTVLAKCESDADMCGEPLIPLMDKIFEAMARGESLFDLENETTYITYEDAQEIYEKLNSESVISEINPESGSKYRFH